MLQRAFVGSQRFELMLGEVTHREAFAVASPPAVQRELAGEQFDQRRFAGAVAPQQADALAGAQGERDIAQHRRAVVADRGLVERDQRIGRRRRGTKAEGERRIDMGGADQLHAFERLDAALRLARLGRLGAETIDEGVQVGALALLLFEHRLLLREALAALALEGGVAAGIQGEALLLDMGDMIDHGVDEHAIVRDQQQGAAVVAQPLFEPDHRVQVEVVGGLVEQQQVGAAHQRLREVEPHAPAAGKVGHRARDVGRRKAEAIEQGGGSRRRAVAVDLLQAAMQFADALAGVCGFGDGQIGFDAAQFAIAIEHEVERRARQRGRLLRDMGDHPARGQFAIAAIGRKLAAQQREQAGLAGAVGAGERDFPARVNLQSRAIYEHFGGTREAQLTKLDHVGRSGEKPLLYGLPRLLLSPLMPLRPRHCLLALATLLAASAAFAQEEDSRALRERADALRAAAEQRFTATSATCYDKFFVNACLDDARQARTAAILEARKLEGHANRIARAKRIEAMEERLRKSGMIAPPPGAPADTPSDTP